MVALLRYTQVESQLHAAVRQDSRGVETIDTLDVPPDLRTAVWEARTHSHLVGLRAGSPSSQGLLASMRSARFEGLSIADIRGNDHTVERTQVISRRRPIESVVFTFVLTGESFHYNGRTTLLVKEGDVAVYDSDAPFLLGFSSRMRVLVATVPRYHLADVGMGEAFHQTRVLRHAGGGVEAQAAARLLRVLQEALEPSDALGQGGDGLDAGERVVARTLRAVRDLPSGSRRLGADYVAAAMHVIDRRLGDPALSIGEVADELGVSGRHLARVFAASGATVGQVIHERRLQRAHAMLTAADVGGLRAGEVALRCGFVSPSHFSRAFRARFGMTPTQAKRGIA